MSKLMEENTCLGRKGVQVGLLAFSSPHKITSQKAASHGWLGHAFRAPCKKSVYYMSLLCYNYTIIFISSHAIIITFCDILQREAMGMPAIYEGIYHHRLNSLFFSASFGKVAFMPGPIFNTRIIYYQPRLWDVGASPFKPVWWCLLVRSDTGSWFPYHLAADRLLLHWIYYLGCSTSFLPQ